MIDWWILAAKAGTQSSSPAASHIIKTEKLFNDNLLIVLYFNLIKPLSRGASDSLPNILYKLYIKSINNSKSLPITPITPITSAPFDDKSFVPFINPLIFSYFY